jgi:hypothetical protein
MAALVSDAYMSALLKTVYLSGVANNKSQNSPFLSMIDKDTFVGKEMKYAMQYGNGGNFGSNYAQLVGNKTSGAKNGEWTMTPGYMTGFFNISQPEILQSESDKAAYMKILANKMSACFDGMSKTLAMYLYGGENAVIDRLSADVTFATGVAVGIPVSSAGSIKLDIGSRIVFATKGSQDAAVPSDPLLGAGSYATVTNIDDYEITVMPEAGLNGLTAYKGDYIELYGCRGSNGTNGIQGLEDFIPTIGDRSDSDARWTQYIATDFRGVDRSVAVNRLAGQFVKAASTGNHPLTDALMTLLKKTKRQGGGINNVLLINDEDFDAVQKEADLTRNFITNTDGSAKAKKNAVFGLNDFSVAFGDATSGDTIIDPFCTYGKAYSIDKNDLSFYDMGNMGRVIAPVSNGQIGKYDIEGVGEQGMGNDPKVSLNTDKLFTVTQSTNGEFGPEFTIAANLFGQFALRKTASSGVAVLR